MAKVKLISYTPDAERIVAAAAKLCYSESNATEIMDNLTDEKVGKFLKILMNLGHESPIEHINFTFAVEDVSRVFSHQLVRHRIASYSQQSQRYVRQDNFNYITPPTIAIDEYTNDLFKQAMEASKASYQVLVEALLEKSCSFFLDREGIHPDLEERVDVVGVIEIVKNEFPKKFKEFEKKAIEDARFVFPNACETKIVFTMNARTLLNFFEKRCCRRAQWEINEVAWDMLSAVSKVAPTIFSKAGPTCLHGQCKEGNMSCGAPYGKF